ncbi:MAG TPA: isocitrate lyase/phosphoenolpyruvate mutase family protein [Stellaceae bacterium]|nr:isocitrate lyase/phosphoenolpyruvate mutase family protein [Stellaceae bacterium]
MTHAETADWFRARHHRKPLLLLPNAWDGASARMFAAAGFEAIATTSGGLAWSLGYPDGEHAPWDEVLAATRRIVRAARVPVTADIEAGYADTPQELGRHIAEIIATGVVGVNLEDGLHDAPHIRDAADAQRRIDAARAAATREGVPIVINARSDLYLFNLRDEATRFSETVARGKAYIAAGADCVYPMGLRDPAVIARFVPEVGAPVNITGRAGMPDAATFERMGVARITIASAPTLVAMSAVKALAEQLKADGKFDNLAAGVRHPDAQALFAT